MYLSTFGRLCAISETNYILVKLWLCFIVASFKSNVDEDTPQKKREALNAFLPRRKTIKDLKDKNIYKFGTVCFLLSKLKRDNRICSE